MIVNRKNFSSSTLQSAVGSGDTTIMLQTGSGANFPTATTGLSYFWATIRTTDYSKKEVVKVVNTSGDVFTIERAQQNTLANTFSASDIVEHTITADEMPNQEVNTNSTPTFDSLKLSPTPTNSEPLSEGHLRYDATERTLSLGVGYGSVLQIGQEQYIRVRNNTGGTITNGKVVYISGSLGNRPTVALAKADIISTSEATIGMATGDILNNADGFITISGVVHDLDTSAYNEGDPLYLSDTVFGGLTTTKPSGAYVVKIGLVTRSHAVQGEILVTIDNNTVAKQLTDELEIRLVVGTTVVQSANTASNGTTQAEGTANTTLATTEFVDRLRDILPVVKSASYTLALTDRGKSIDFTGSTGQTITIPANATVAFPVGTTVTISNLTSNNLSIAITTDTLRQAGTSNTGTRTLGQYGVVTIRKVSSTVWIISGSGLS